MTFEETQGIRLREAAKWWPCSESTMRSNIRKGLVRAHRITPNGPLSFHKHELLEDRARINEPTQSQEPAPTLEDYRRELHENH